MRSCRIVVVLVALAPGSTSALAAPFVNLNFEQATVPPGTPPGSSIPSALAFPGWTPRLNQTVLNSVYYNHHGFGEGAVELYDMPKTSIGLPLFEGRYSAAVIGSADLVTRFSLSQAGDVPDDARSIRFLSTRLLGPPVLMLDGIALPLTLLVSGPLTGPSTFGADVTSFAGNIVTMTFMSTLPPDGLVSGLDAILFSAEPIPEPMSLWLLTLIYFLLKPGRG